MKQLLLMSLIFSFMLSGCGFLAGGGDYKYRYKDPSGKDVAVTVHSARKIGPTKVQFDSNGTVTVDTKSLAPGPNNLGQALVIIDGLIKASATAATP